MTTATIRLNTPPVLNLQPAGGSLALRAVRGQRGRPGPGTSDEEIAARILAEGPVVNRVRMINTFDEFFGGKDNTFVTGQRVTSTTVTAGVAAGADVLPLASVTDVIAGMWLVLNHDSADPQLVKVVSVAGSDVTVTPDVEDPITNGDAVWPLWESAAHITTGAHIPFWRHVANSDAFEDPGTDDVVLFGNSWTVAGFTAFEDALQARFPAANVIDAGVSGNTSQDLLDRFATDVTGSPAYVVFNEPGVNDTSSRIPLSIQGEQFTKLAAKIEALGAIPVFVGPVPLVSWKRDAEAAAGGFDGLAANQPQKWSARAIPNINGETTALLNQTRIGHLTHRQSPTGLYATAFGYAAQQDLTTGDNNNAFGYTVQQRATTGHSNNGFGSQVQQDLTTGARNTGMGHATQGDVTIGNDNTGMGYAVQRALLDGVHNVGIGANAQADIVSADNNVGIGSNAQADLISGNDNVGIGYASMRTPNGVTANAHTTAARGTCIGAQTGLTSATQANNITAIGYKATAGATDATAIGSLAAALHADAVALGSDTITTAAFQIEIGPRHVEASELAADPAAPAANTARWYAKDNGAGKTGLYVRFPTGAVQQIALEP